MENTYISDENISLVEKIARGDMRKAINLLQSCRNFKNLISNTKEVDKIDTSIIQNISGVIAIDTLHQFIELCISGKMDKVNEMIDTFYNESYSLTVNIQHILDIIIYHKILTDKKKSLIIQKILSIDNYLLNGCDELIQYNRLAYYICEVCTGHS